MSLHLSSHASRRLQQRGIQQTTVSLVMSLYDIDHCVGDDCRALRVSRRALHEARDLIKEKQWLEHLSDVIVVWSDRNHQIVTAFKGSAGAQVRPYLGRR